MINKIQPLTQTKARCFQGFMQIVGALVNQLFVTLRRLINDFYVILRM